MIVIGVDVGGTFTDIILTNIDTGRIFVHKVPSTPKSQDIAAMRGMTEILELNGLDPTSVEIVVHGTTVATNAMLERKGADVCLITTAGMEDVLQIGRQNRMDIYDLNALRPEPIVKDKDRFGLYERLDSEGNPIINLDDEEITNMVRRIDSRSPQSVAIALLFSFLNPKHEKSMVDALQGNEHLYIAASHEVLPEFREFERTSTTVLEAYLGPLIQKYLSRLDNSIGTLCPNSKLTLMQSNGGTILGSQTKGRSVGLAISGLAGGVIGGWKIAKKSGVAKAITLDMGGTSCDISAVSDSVLVRPDNSIGGLPLRTPSVDVKTIGAGGGSIGWIDKAGVLHVGPQSTGADPGPAAYGKGGVDATVTDANLVLGRLNPDYFVGGRIKLDPQISLKVISTLGKRLDRTPQETALGVIRIATSNMVQAIREVTIERGKDPRSFVLVPFGGAGPTQGVDIADALSIDTILVPQFPGITSAFGLVCADLRVDLMQSILISDLTSAENELRQVFNKLTERAKDDLLSQGARLDSIFTYWSIDMRYQGQSHELAIEVPFMVDNLVGISQARFKKEHEAAFGYSLQGRNIEWVTVRVVGKSMYIGEHESEIDGKDRGRSVGTREVVLDDNQLVTADVYRREMLSPGQILEGPAILEQMDTTVYVNPRWSAKMRKNGTLLMKRRGSK